MKKVKTIIASVVVIIASIFVSACSCGDSSVPQVYVTDINIKCVTPDSNGVWSYWGTLDDDSSSSGGTLDENTGILNICCRVGETFKIEYNLDPVDATFTQVNWEFGTVGLVKTRSGESFRKKSTNEVVEFVAQDRSKNRYTTTLTFTANITGSGKNGTEKSVTCKITVYDKVADQPTLSAPSNVHFNSDLNRIEWDKVTTLIDSNNNVYTPSASEITNGVIDGLSEYRVRIKDEDGELVEEKRVDYTKTYCPMPATGNQYSVEICAVGSEAVNSSSYTQPYSFYKLSDVTDLANNNGDITFKHPKMASKYTIYYYGLNNSSNKNQMSQLVSSDELNRNNSIRTTDFVGDTGVSDKYNIALVFYPENYDESKGYSEINGVKYFPSTSETSKVIQKLSAPTISLRTDKGDVTVGGVNFANSYLDTKVVWSLDNYNELIGHHVQFEYVITKGDGSEITGSTNDLKYTLSEAGHYSIKVRTIGDASSTVYSAQSEAFAFDVIDDSDISYEFNSDTTTSDNGDCLKDKSTRGAGGLEVFFVYNTNPSLAQKNSRRVEVPSGGVLDISTLGLASGNYNMYIKHISTSALTTGNVAVINGNQLTTPEEDTITISPSIVNSSFTITKEGKIKFDCPVDNNITQYNICITQADNTSMEILAVGGDAEDGQVSYIKEGSKIVIDLYDVLRQMITIASGDIEVDIEQKLYEYLFKSETQSNFACQVQAVGYKGSSAVVVSSAFTEKVSFQGSSPVGDLTLNNYKLSFADTNNQQYIVELIIKEKNSTEVYKKYQFTHATSTYKVNNNRVEIDLTSEEIWEDTSNNSRYTLAQLVDTQRDNYLSVISLGQDGMGTTWAIINTLTALTPVHVAHTPTALKMNGQDGKIYWNTTSLDTDYTYTIYFAEVEKEGETESYNPLTSETLTRVTATLSDTKETYKTYCYDIGEVLARYPDKIISVTIVENRSNKFSSEVSENFYATRISAPQPNYVEESNIKKIKWDAITNAEYYLISVTKEGDEGFEFEPQKGGSTEFSITEKINAEDGWTEGVYTIYIVAGTDFSGSSSIDSPFVITSVSANKVIRIVSGSLLVSVDDQKISWNNICNGTEIEADYSISYGEGSPITEGYTYSADGSIVSLNIGDELKVGNNEIIVTPSISYQDTGFVIIGTPYTNNITKWDVASDLVASSGTLQFKVNGVSDDENVIIELYQAQDGSDTLVSSSLYSISSDVKDGFVLYTISLDGLNEGSLGLKVKIKSEGKISSALSPAFTATKLKTITNLSKTGEWLTWSSSEQGIDKFIISYRPKSSATYTQLTLNVEYSNGTYVCYIPNSESEIGEIDENKFKFDKDTGTFSYKFDEEVLVGSEITGDIYITIRAMADEGYYNGNTSSACVITKLNKNTEVTASNGVLSFEKYEADGSAVPSGYELSIYLLNEVDTDGTVTYVRSETKKYTTSGAYSESTGIENIDLNDTSIGLTELGLYEIVLKYIGNGNEVLDSAEYTITIEKLDVGTLSTQNGKIAWTNIEGATSYTLELSSSEGIQTIEISKASQENTIVIEESDLVDIQLVSGEKYTLRVMANAEGKLHSKWSDTFVVRKLKAPTVIQITTSESGSEDVPYGTPIITWVDPNSNNSAYTYQLKYDCTDSSIENDENKTAIDIPALQNKQYVIERGLKEGDYKVLLRVMGNTVTSAGSIGLLTSDYAGNPSTVLHYVADVNEPTVENGVISWTEIAGAYSYKVSAYDSTNTPKFTLYTVDTSINFSRFAMGSQDVSDWGTFKFTINALTDPRLSVISTVAEFDNIATLYKPRTLENYRVKDGMLNWRIAISDIVDLVNTNQDLLTEAGLSGNNSNVITLAVVKYVIDAINGSESFENNETIDSILTYLLKIRLNINSIEIEDVPTSVMVVGSDGAKIESENSYIASGNYLEYSYDVSIEPTIGGDDDTTEEEGGSESEEEISTQSEETTNPYNAGKYVIRLSAIGNSSSVVPIVNGSYTSTLTAYKPDAPITWSRQDSDIYMGQVQWGLSTTPQSTNTTFYYHQDYKVSAVSVDNSGNIITKAYRNVNVNDTSSEGRNPNLSNGYQYYRNLKGDLFTTADHAMSGITNNQIDYNTEYRILINVIGTKDSTQLTSGEYIYLNSNACVVSEHANILAVTNNTKVTNNTLSWNFSQGSTMTRVFVYGPFNNLDGSSQTDSTTRNINWTSTETSKERLQRIYNAYQYINHMDYDEALLPKRTGTTEIDLATTREWASLLRVLDFRDNVGKRETEYTLTDMIYNDSSFEAGGYQLKFQEIGNNRGVIDSVISESSLSVEKLSQPVAQSTGWVGTTNCNVYRWDGMKSSSDTWSTTDDYSEGQPCAKIGTFVWDRVIGANAYRVVFYRKSADGTVNKIEENIVTRETYYEPKDDPDQTSGDTYYITIVAVRLKDNSDSELADNFFMSDTSTTEEFHRLTAPSDIQVYDNGNIQWSNYSSDTSVGGYRVQFGLNANEQTAIDATTSPSTSIASAEFDMSSKVGSAGNITIRIKTIATSGTKVLSSGYSSAITVTCLADPYVRLVDGVFNWGWINGDIAVDPETDSRLLIDEEKTIIKKESAVTYSKYYTEIDTHKKSYTSEKDETQYTVGTHTFKVQFLGSGGETSKPLADGSYIASNEKELTAYKLPAPEISNVPLNLSEESENLVQWNPITHALGYKVRAFYKTEYKEYTISVADLESITDNDNEFAVHKTDGEIDKIYFRLSSVIAHFNLLQTGGELYIYVQALGSTSDVVDGEDTLYLSSSYSTPSTIGIPPSVDSLTYEETGTIRWNIDTDGAYGIKLQTSYEVEDVTIEEWNNYWSVSAHNITIDNTVQPSIASPSYTPEPLTGKLESRSVTRTSTTVDGQTSYKLSVIDIIYLQDTNSTPTSYKLTTIGKNYNFEVTATSFRTTTSDESVLQFASATSSLNRNSLFNAFGKGDGSTRYKYTIADYDQLDRVRNFADRHFELASNIDFKDSKNEDRTWNIITERFDGSIDGKGKVLNNVNVIKPNTIGNCGMYALFQSNYGTISNLTINIYMSVVGDYTGIKASALAINNYGTIDNITVTGIINIGGTSNSIPDGTQVGGIVVNNYADATISNSTVSASITALDNDTLVMAGGISANNYGTINLSTFSGNIKSNYVGGIVGFSNGIIDRCNITKNAVITGTDGAYSSSSYESPTIGGIVAGISGSAKVTYSYSLATIYINRSTGNSESLTVGGLVGSIGGNQTTVVGNYVVSKITSVTTIDNTSGIHKYDMMQIAFGTIENNYYLVGSVASGQQTITPSSEGGTKCDSLKKLNDAVANIEDGGKKVYNTINTSDYPTLSSNA